MTDDDAREAQRFLNQFYATEELFPEPSTSRERAAERYMVMAAWAAALEYARAKGDGDE